MLSVVEVAKTSPQIFDRLSPLITEIFPLTSLRQAQGKRSGNISRLRVRAFA
ncbi:MAG: hypothetical protein HC916_10620 [Coleofasciculaceae cyanobacterium SM2_1_6]|nr:hypothetical protein [Coleofasciculaceae cyanobacterium SM2_1_6]